MTALGSKNLTEQNLDLQINTLVSSQMCLYSLTFVIVFFHNLSSVFEPHAFSYQIAILQTSNFVLWIFCKTIQLQPYGPQVWFQFRPVLATFLRFLSKNALVVVLIFCNTICCKDIGWPSPFSCLRFGLTSCRVQLKSLFSSFSFFFPGRAIFNYLLWLQLVT